MYIVQRSDKTMLWDTFGYNIMMRSDIMELNDALYEKITNYCNSGDTLYDNGEYHDAIKMYKKAFEILPEPKEEWEATTWICSALADAFAEVGETEKSLQYALLADKCPNGVMNPYIQLQVGMSFFDIGNKNKAREYLLRAYMLEGEDIFSDVTSEYFALIQDLIQEK